ncbi:hypothetical protein SDC9_199760 [bioreactor metagenome]|uniref:Uncharacterized protein n=1 Tax=bioreactor metagenome TaxID=1076179 RepID=A0A645IM40_9ZZZZ
MGRNVGRRQKAQGQRKAYGQKRTGHAHGDGVHKRTQPRAPVAGVRGCHLAQQVPQGGAALKNARHICQAGIGNAQGYAQGDAAYQHQAFAVILGDVVDNKGRFHRGHPYILARSRFRIFARSRTTS